MILIIFELNAAKRFDDWKQNPWVTGNAEPARVLRPRCLVDMEFRLIHILWDVVEPELGAILHGDIF